MTRFPVAELTRKDLASTKNIVVTERLVNGGHVQRIKMVIIRLLSYARSTRFPSLLIR